MPNLQAQRFISYALALSLAGTGLFATEKNLRHQRVREQLTVTPPPPLLAQFTAGHARGVSAILWLQLLTWYGGNVRLAKSQRITKASNIEFLIRQTELILHLDSDFPDPYSFTPMVLAWYTNRPEAGLPFLREAMVRYPDDWTYPFYYGFIHFRFLNERNIAARFFLLAGNKRDCPPYIPLLGAKLLRESEGSQDVIVLLEEMLHADMQASVRQKIESEIVTLKAIKLVEDAVAAYRKRYNQIPKMSDLIHSKLLAAVPYDAEGMPIQIDRDGRPYATTGGMH